MVVKIEQEAEPPSGSRQSIFMIGQDGGGNWVVQDLSGVHGGLFKAEIAGKSWSWSAEFSNST
jgi:hypothetical protein